eukprot:CAMPEP_0185181538 /NCGR_PEP_ID=MMETSP1140-20130426/106_1 /TAXON_ID=298111 /ORGANISM="Pavlova sp., Strain CCMP459" /LENGTH=266 /DNA_ID=CAMNT_0027747379 /DNA_START=194 /DNA_END=995 /DNA_ORIENTATION=+
MLCQVLISAGSSTVAMRLHRPEDDCVDRDGVRARSVTETAPWVEAAVSLAAAEIKARRFASLSGAHAEQHVAEAVSVNVLVPRLRELRYRLPPHSTHVAEVVRVIEVQVLQLALSGDAMRIHAELARAGTPLDGPCARKDASAWIKGTQELGLPLILCVAHECLPVVLAHVRSHLWAMRDLGAATSALHRFCARCHMEGPRCDPCPPDACWLADEEEMMPTCLALGGGKGRGRDESAAVLMCTASSDPQIVFAYDTHMSTHNYTIN